MNESGAWTQFLIAKQAMIAEYYSARQHSKGLPIQTYHGNVAEGIFRRWLESFLPKRYGVTSGYIRGQKLTEPHSDRHYDVIIYDQLESPVLWIDRSPDHSESGKIRMIPAEYVTAILEVKAGLSSRSAKEAIWKLNELEPLMVGIDAPGERYPTYLRPTTVIATVFFEVLQSKASEVESLSTLYDDWIKLRPFLGALVLSGDEKSGSATGLTKLLVANPGISGLPPYGNLLSPHCSVPAKCVPDRECTVVMDWMETNFATFAFDLLALMSGRFERGRVSSFFPLDLGVLSFSVQ